MTEPTDAEIWQMWMPMVRRMGVADPVEFARAVLAKWGTPPAVAGEPECTCSAKDMPFGTCCKVRSAFERWYDEQNDGRLQPFDVFKGGWIERHRLSSTPQPTQAQAGVPCRKNPFYHGPRNCSRGTVGCCEDHGAKPQPQAGAVPLYRLLQSGVDRIEAADEFLSDDTTAWAIDPNGIFVGSIYGGHVLRPARRCIKGGQHGAE